ncbi:hypothetical protein A7A08_01640 [Methyloligella halotolerans]|uniref:YrhK domain-containing protein n=1 Tax=Methyloligella halotolerans TaxID=1177755 RepID=A0A1E2RZE8_9HYPH|nr:YrhK family protein [Methyloligella halotolerans]ODA67606.1 hypothetical protein A7A08_01640 [Methyloligella halotolerans]
MTELIRLLVCKYSWVHLSLGLLGNTAFFIGSIMFLPSFESWKTFAVWLFIGGAFFMLIGAIGQFLVYTLDDVPAAPKLGQDRGG